MFNQFCLLIVKLIEFLGVWPLEFIGVKVLELSLLPPLLNPIDFDESIVFKLEAEFNLNLLNRLLTSEIDEFLPESKVFGINLNNFKDWLLFQILNFRTPSSRT
ncbi:hypothetical protein WICMUC_002801 [Wickerhamomyces mucosus]|uniref:Uncharacterized protein n=1 Tax=Wickerhamomyces mucosus TaxID=1378264 RepID=A0A9P8PP79_9ASCO|nr:hypothetical protein WICMUC_002801 [Wickerhamomyces mucosus]